MEKVFVVIPTNRDLDFLDKWKGEFKQTTGIIIEGHQSQEIKTPHKHFKKVYHYTWEDIDKEFGKNSWIFSRWNAGIRSYGFYRAFKLGAEIIVTLDDDCYPVETDFLDKHMENLSFKAPENWWPTYPNPELMFTRGFPYEVRNKLPVKISHGLWAGALDLDAKTEVKLKTLLNEKVYPPMRQVIPIKYFFPMCSMNLAFRREATPVMYFPLMGKKQADRNWAFDRYDDIWAGLFAKKIADHLGWAVVNGSPFVDHRKKSDPRKNLPKERLGMKANESLWKMVDQVKLTKNSPAECYAELARKIKFPKNAYFNKLKKAMLIWAGMFDD